MAGGPFKSTQRAARSISVEEMYGRGMQYVNTPLMEGFCKALVNYDIKDMGAKMTPRLGFGVIHDQLVTRSLVNRELHHIGQAAVYNTVTEEDTSMRYALFTPVDNTQEFVAFSDCVLLLENVFIPNSSQTPSFFTAVLDTTEEVYIRRNARAVIESLHDVPLTSTGAFATHPYNEVHATLNGFTLMPIKVVDGEENTYGLGKLAITTAGTGTYNAELGYVTPKELMPTFATNYGYNMLSDIPYTFTDRVSGSVADGYLIMEGIVPYSDETCTDIKFNARVGESVTFRMYGQYANTTDRFKLRWEVRELNGDTVTTYLTQHNAPETGNGAPAILTITAPYKQFSVTVTAYTAADLTEPLQVMVLGAYTTADDIAGSTSNIEPRNYALHTATDMAVWRQRVVLWGVQGAKNILFTSDINDPTYFPYPNGIELFEEDIIACLPYLGDLLVFTQSRLYRISLSPDGNSMVTDMIQDRLRLSEFDKETILLVQNMVFFKNGSYYYMIVPRTSSNEPGALQLAPISTPITQLLDNFHAESYTILDTLYNFQDSELFTNISVGSRRNFRLMDYHNYLDNAVVRNVYKWELVEEYDDPLLNPRPILVLDMLLNYDTMGRTWTIYAHQGNYSRLVPYRQTVTDTTIYMQALDIPERYVEDEEEILGIELHSEFIRPIANSHTDNISLLFDGSLVPPTCLNHQMMDTGYREHNNTYKKRYREIQFRINALIQSSLQFGTAFILDEQTRKSLHNYTVHQETAPESPEYGLVSVERRFADPEDALGATMLESPDTLDAPYLDTTYVTASTAVELLTNRWVLDLSQLANAIAYKIRFRVSGKGHAPRFILVSFNDRPYELLSHAWVYRMMNAR